MGLEVGGRYAYLVEEVERRVEHRHLRLVLRGLIGERLEELGLLERLQQALEGFFQANLSTLQFCIGIFLFFLMRLTYQYLHVPDCPRARGTCPSSP